MVLKPAELTPLTAIRIGELAVEAGLPDGVFTVLPGKGSVVGERLIEHPAVRKLVFTGSTEVGKHVMRGAAEHVKRVRLSWAARVPTSSLLMLTSSAQQPRRLTASSTTLVRTVARGPAFSSSVRPTTDSCRCSNRQ